MQNPIDFFKALADDTRLQMLLLIQQEEELCVCELMAALNEHQPKISRHLAQLRKQGILQDRRQGQWVFYRLAASLTPWEQQVLQSTAQHQTSYLATANLRLQHMGTRPERNQQCC
ncbi:metalloregulator ArsR/SmtB family transcription factor [Alkalimonas sp. MEB108]|uniref:Metalloregulator ArsR/SmtB family transcription factor n=1 Tax=Alkalimonas cellulosilytica TaxID=3058395 RepID=A0ABU7J3K9_9GAMM|nr:metalloregulator ArsR/SmtB family transcription factor [Alkalimonas sp. MEB108]MEE2000962.1 metalloregulator ArsR/SmtB family transcription factor [Alkalimonas sp. MEB108]